MNDVGRVEYAVVVPVVLGKRCRASRFEFASLKHLHEVFRPKHTIPVAVADHDICRKRPFALELSNVFPNAPRKRRSPLFSIVVLPFEKSFVGVATEQLDADY